MMTRKSNNRHEGSKRIEHLNPNSPDTQEILASTCIYDPQWQVRLKAVEGVLKPTLLARIAQHSKDYDVVKAAIERINDEERLEEIALFPCEDKFACILALRKLNNQDTLLIIAQRHPYTDVRIEAVLHLTDEQTLLRIAESNNDLEVREAAVAKLTNQEALAHIACTDCSRAVRKAAVASLVDLEQLTSIAADTQPMVIRRNALHRMKSLCKDENLDKVLAEQLLPCLKESPLVAYTVELLDKSGLEWWNRCSEETIEAFSAALFNCQQQMEAIILEKALVRLYRNRIDLRGLLQSHIPQLFNAQARCKQSVWEMLPILQFENHTLAG